MPERPDLRNLANSIREALDTYPREALAEILTYVFQAYVVEGVPPVHAAQAERMPELEGLAFPDLIQALQMRLDVPELSMFEVVNGRVNLRLGNESIHVAMGAEARRVAAAPLPSQQPPTPPPAPATTPGTSTTELRPANPPPRQQPAAAPAAEAPRPRGISVNPGGGARPSAPTQAGAPTRTSSTAPIDEVADDDAASRRFKLLEID